MKNHLVIFIVLLLGLTSCGLQKSVMSQDVQAESTTSSNDSTALSKELERFVLEHMRQMLARELTNDLVIERKVWSPPDTAGNQFIVSEERVTSETRVKEMQTSTSAAVEEVSEKTDSTSVSASVEDLVLDAEIDTTEKDGLPWWQMTLMVIGATVLLLIIIRIALKLL